MIQKLLLNLPMNYQRRHSLSRCTGSYGWRIACYTLAFGSNSAPVTARCLWTHLARPSHTIDTIDTIRPYGHSSYSVRVQLF